MSIDLEYAIKRDIRNNPVVREADRRHGRDLRRNLFLMALTVAMLVFSVRQRSNKIDAGYRIEKLRLDQQNEESLNRQLRLNVAALTAAPRIEGRARTMGLRHPSLAETEVVERAREVVPAGAIVARAR